MSAAGRRGAKNALIAATLISTVIGLSGTANASVITTVPVAGTDYTFSGKGDQTPDGLYPGIWTNGPETVSAGVTWSSNVGFTDEGTPIIGGIYGISAELGFTDNGSWKGTPAVAIDYAKGTMTIAFSTPVAAVGGILNWAKEGTATIAVYNSSWGLIELKKLNNNNSNSTTPANAFYGFSEKDNSISYFTLSDDYIGLRTLTTAVVTPLPGALPLFLGGLGAIGLLGWRRRSKAAA